MISFLTLYFVLLIHRPTVIRAFTKHLIDEIKVIGISAGGDISSFIINGPTSSELYVVGHGLYGSLGNGAVNSKTHNFARNFFLSSYFYF